MAGPPAWVPLCRRAGVLRVRPPKFDCPNSGADEKDTYPASTPGGPQEMLSVSEAGALGHAARWVSPAAWRRRHRVAATQANGKGTRARLGGPIRRVLL